MREQRGRPEAFVIEAAAERDTRGVGDDDEEEEEDDDEF